MMHKIELAPDIFQNMKGFKTWKKVEVRTIREIKTRIEILHKIPEKIDSILNVEETAEWSDFHNKKYLTLLLEYGIDSMKTLLIDDRFGFSQFVSLTDMDYLSGKKKRRNLALSNLPEYLFDENLLLDYLNGQYQTNHQYNANGDAGDGGEMFEYDFRENLKKQENVPPNPQQNNSDHDISFDFEQAYDDDDKVFKL
ncbi:SNF2 family N-terminal domain containing protein [Histomonas meleagridis]|uniref:SNF2 family N-terminal domain containing protein n=1 Tax=Histomonas meleagridis TaxID=135588 RepID=UPI00355AC1D1|nr:SNF2 family N-terminal domain containing protein [Histomonas meleagridis]KAH0797894.1 SNF2 family N-terminal domain containing protein [Histomonas meleagridis]